jgi:hypothetical protein
MALTPEQLQTLKTAILADPVLANQPMDGDGNGVIADAMNAQASPDYWIWRSKVTQDEIMQNGFDWVRVDNLSVGKARIWEWLFDNRESVINPSKVNVRAGIAECWKGTTADNAVRAAVFLHCQRLASRGEKLFSTGSGTSTNGDGVGPATSTFEGLITPSEVDAARHLP